ncbi:uracil-DNA glycosylase [Streptomyces sp. NPDC088341]|uniref:uracil-DNA glycosylase n=1 Tax=Streptomyces sp. NPDC088341 TaxID=3154870 RepID=UPI00341F8641
MKAIDTDRFWELLRALPVPDDAESPHGPDENGRLRDRNLRHYFELMADIRPDVILIGEAPGYRGHTITGVPFMSMRQLTARPGLITGAPEGDGFEPPEAPAFTWEASSAAVWGALADWRGPLPISWPVYPNHPHEPGRPESNRTPRAAEIAAGVPIVMELAGAFSITTIIAVGRKAQYALARNGVTATAVRHPAQGGARIFATQLAALNRA